MQSGATWLLARRQDNGERRAAGRIVMSELYERYQNLQFALGENLWSSLEDEVRITTWTEHRAVLARVLSPEAWDAVHKAVSDASLLHSVAQRRRPDEPIYPGPDEPAANRFELASMTHTYAEALEQLARVAQWESLAEQARLDFVPDETSQELEGEGMRLTDV
jgi:hypothetical protein